MKIIASIGAILIAAVFGWAGIAAKKTSPTAVLVKTQNTASLYTTYCVKCHGADGRGQTQKGKETHAQDFTSAKWKSRTSTGDAAATIRDGYQDMPSYKKRLTGAQIQALATYVKGFPH